MARKTGQALREEHERGRAERARIPALADTLPSKRVLEVEEYVETARLHWVQQLEELAETARQAGLLGVASQNIIALLKLSSLGARQQPTTSGLTLTAEQLAGLADALRVARATVISPEKP